MSFKTVSQVFVHKFFSVVIGQWPTCLRVFVFEVFEVLSCVVPSDSEHDMRYCVFALVTDLNFEFYCDVK